jgi:hypothetical protein
MPRTDGLISGTRLGPYTSVLFHSGTQALSPGNVRLVTETY